MGNSIKKEIGSDPVCKEKYLITKLNLTKVKSVQNYHEDEMLKRVLLHLVINHIDWLFLSFIYKKWFTNHLLGIIKIKRK